MCIKKIKVSLSGGFCVASILFVLTILGIMYLSHRKYMSTQNAIKDSHRTHIQRIESYVSDFNSLIEDEYGKIIVTTTKIIDSLNNVPRKRQHVIEKDFYTGIIATIKSNSLNDVSTFNHQLNLAQKELLLNQQNLERLLELHYAELDNQQITLTIWAAVLSIIFLTFGFFAIFKIEETKKEAKAYLDDTENKCKEISNKLTDVNSKIFQNIQTSNDAQASLSQKEKEITDLITSLSKGENDVKNKIAGILKECDNLEDLINNHTKSMNEGYQLRLNSTIEQGTKIIQQMKDKFDALAQKHEEQQGK